MPDEKEKNQDQLTDVQQFCRAFWEMTEADQELPPKAKETPDE